MGMTEQKKSLREGRHSLRNEQLPDNKQQKEEQAHQISKHRLR